MKGILDLGKFQQERGEDIALQRFMQKQQKERLTKGIARPSNISREVFALMTNEEIMKLQQQEEGDEGN